MLLRDTQWFRDRTDLGELPVVRVAGKRLVTSEQSFTIDAPRPDVWERYCTTRPSEVWPEERIVFRFAVMPDGSWVGPSAPWPGLVEGTKLFSDLKVWPPYEHLRLMVAVEVTSIDPWREVRYDYLQGSVTQGYNVIRFEDEGGDRTRVVHRAQYRGTSRTDRLLLPVLDPILHVGFVRALHLGMKRRIESCAG